MAVRQGSWTKDPTDEQIRRQASRQYWNFPCPDCGNGCLGYGADPVYHIKCLDCGWEWKDGIPSVTQTTLEEFEQ